MNFIKDLKPVTRIILILCLTAIIITFLVLTAYSGFFGDLIDGLFGLAK